MFLLGAALGGILGYLISHYVLQYVAKNTFYYGQEVTIVSGFYKGHLGIIQQILEKPNLYNDYKFTYRMEIKWGPSVLKNYTIDVMPRDLKGLPKGFIQKWIEENSK